MINAIKKFLNNKKHLNISVTCVLCVTFIGLSIWYLSGANTPTIEDGDLEVIADLEEEAVPLASYSGQISVGDIIAINVTADELEKVYGYQLDVYYNRDYLEYNKSLYSDIDDIITIFATDKEKYLLVGATMIGDAEGYSGQEVPVCRVEFTALNDFILTEYLASELFGISRVNIVTDELQYLENVEGWTASMSVKFNSSFP